MRDTTPLDLTITPRDRRFGRGDKTARWWNGGDPVATAFYNALSATFPKGETFFVDSVRNFREGLPARLAGEVQAFIKQEAMHSREHSAFNARAQDAGYDLKPLEALADERIDRARSRPPIVGLAVTMALEHFTAIFAHELLRDPRHLEDADPASRELWQWHAIEELEHKGVAYDVWLHATRAWPRAARWQFKSQVMLLVTQHFVVGRALGAMELLRQDGITGPRAAARLLSFAMVRPGMLRKLMGAWALYFMPGFHPWNQDDRALIAEVEKLLAQAATVAA
jgi:uncharacterized protein